ncbi:MAG: NAD(P)-dependent oxidoreductase [Deltaproteobacteria bacterium]|jgi:nucleoside-diphosphate-sugar epimerase|nr:NAD(P)-dependent oxidoreductase [Deltaproteobacteria bacterium]
MTFNIDLPALRENKIHRKILIVGGAGYIGLALTKELLEAGYEVTVFDSLIHGHEPLDFLLNKPRLNFVKGDIRDIGLVNQTVKGHWGVVLLAALVGVEACDKDRQQTLEINYLASQNVVECAFSQLVKRFIFASTDSCYGQRPGEKLNELAYLDPLSIYAVYKSKMEEKVLSMPFSAYFSPVILRLGTVYGMSPRPRFDLVVNLLVREIVLRGVATIYSGEQWRPLVHVRDVARAFRLALEAPRYLIHDQIFNVGADQDNVQFKDLKDLLLKINPEGQVTITPGLADLRNYYVVFEKIKKILDFKPSISLLEGMEEIRDSLLSGYPADPYSAKWKNS